MSLKVYFLICFFVSVKKLWNFLLFNTIKHFQKHKNNFFLSFKTVLLQGFKKVMQLLLNRPNKLTHTCLLFWLDSWAMFCLWWLVLLFFQKQRLLSLLATYPIIAIFSLLLDQMLMVILAKDAEKSTHQESQHQHETMARKNLFFLTLSLDNFFSCGSDRPNFCQIKIILIFHINTFLWLFIFLLVWALSFNSKKSNKKSKFLILNWKTKHSISYFTSMINIF